LEFGAIIVVTPWQPNGVIILDVLHSIPGS